LGYDGGLHAGSVLRMGYADNRQPPFRLWGVTRRVWLA
jgi:hypothetical protein